MDISNSTGDSTGYRVMGSGGATPDSLGAKDPKKPARIVLHEGTLEPGTYVTLKVPDDLYIVEFRRGNQVVAQKAIESPKASVVLEETSGQKGIRLFVPAIDAFITHSIGERMRARRLEKILRQHGISTWLDTASPRRPKAELRKVVQGARNFVVLLGPKVEVTEKQRDEWAFALEAVWQDANKRFIPILLEGAKVPAFIRSATSEERPVVPLRIDDPNRNWDDAVASLIRILRSEEDPREAGEPVGITEEDRRRQREWLSHIHEVAESFR